MRILAARPSVPTPGTFWIYLKKEFPSLIICLLDRDDHVMIGFMILGI